MFIYNDGLIDNIYKDKNGNEKYKIVSLGNNYIIVNGEINNENIEFDKYKTYWSQAKDDVSPNQIFSLFKGSSTDRSIIATYCIQDCVLCNILMNKLQVINNNVGMANVCNVPLSFLFLRGQGIKIFSLVSKKCRESNYLIPVIRKKNKDDPIYIKQLDSDDSDDSDGEGYEGATVLEPITGVHYDPIMVLDYASLYPRSMVTGNLSHECYVMDDKYKNLEGWNYNKVEYKNNDGSVTECFFAQKTDGSLGILPQILLQLLKAREDIKNLMKKETDSFKRAILDGLQLAYKVTANSLYGSCGAPTSAIYLKQIGASTTAIGREMLMFAKKFMEQTLPQLVEYIFNNKLAYNEYVINLLQNVKDNKFIDSKKRYSNKNEFIEFIYNELRNILNETSIKPKVIYGDTDSIFTNLNITDKLTNTKMQNKKGLGMSIKIGILSSIFITIILPTYMQIEYEKNLWPLILVSKKRYVGNLFETDTDNFKQKSMGIVLKRRDNAPCVKIMYGGIIDEILNKRNPQGAIDFTKFMLNHILSGKLSIDKFIISKTLKATYADRSRNAHVVLADRMSLRDKGNAPNVNDRIPYCYVETHGKKVTLQGDRIEHPDYIIKNNLKIDYLFYVTNQIMKPCLQILELICENPQKIFDNYTHRVLNMRNNVKPIFHYFQNNNIVDDYGFISSNIKLFDQNTDLSHPKIKVEKSKKIFSKSINNTSQTLLSTFLI